jgi:chlorophyll/bacteriochlorophyll a synthase
MTVQSLPSPTLSPLPAPSAVLELLKPITWFAPMWAYMCGFVSSGAPVAPYLLQIFIGVLLAGPLVCGTSQAANDWYDRHVDAINEPNRPIPSGRIPGTWGFRIAVAWTLLSLLAAAALGQVVFWAAVVGLILAWAYSAPPLRLKLNGWWGNAAVGACYEGLPWLTGAAVATAALPDTRVLIIAALYSIGAHGIMTLNDFKSIEGDRQLGVRSLPVQLGADRAALFCCYVMAIPQVIVIGLLMYWMWPGTVVIVTALLIGQILAMHEMLKDPRGKAAIYNATGTSMYVLGMLAVALALGNRMSGIMV